MGPPGVVREVESDTAVNVDTVVSGVVVVVTVTVVVRVVVGFVFSVVGVVAVVLGVVDFSQLQLQTQLGPDTRLFFGDKRAVG